eukprot:s2492_g8.t1
MLLFLISLTFNLVSVCVGATAFCCLYKDVVLWPCKGKRKAQHEVYYIAKYGEKECTVSGCQSVMLSWFFQWAFCTAGATIVSGAVAERVKAPSYAAFALVMTAFIYPMVVAWTWGGGWMYTLWDVGYMDFAGSGIVHLTGGAAGLAGTVVLGPRKGRFEHPEEFEAHNIPLVVFGTFALWFGWYGFNPGSTLTMKGSNDGALAAQVAMNTTLSAAMGGVMVFLFRVFLTKKYDVGGLCNGILAGLVSITAGCGNMECGSAVVTGLIGGLVYQSASMLLQKLKIDDPVDASPVHGFCGVWGVMAAALFDWGTGASHFHGWSSWSCMAKSDGSCRTYIGGTAIAVNAAMCFVIIAWSASLATITFAVLKKWGALRIDEAVNLVIRDRSHWHGREVPQPSQGLQDQHGLRIHKADEIFSLGAVARLS